MSPEENDGWHASMLDIQLQTTKRAVDELNRVRQRVRVLEAQIAAGPQDVYALQERIVMLEGELKAARSAKDAP